ncbi:hypothetical protein OG462_15070 [Streptomyces sp. NBC_01077]|uniref:effector-associated constant component EACC1 n=1 Tax=Streptomyces sp. NBC_01077 TaxID=2903746 RepID=UPI0038631362|nr:hypothetical protein OG462_15070 [Streptomyces sp. NBC_01077]
MDAYDVDVYVPGGDHMAELEELVDWLRREPELRGGVDLLTGAVGAEDLGALPEMITVAVGGAGVLPVLLQSIQTWLSLRSRSHVRVVIKERGGRKVEIESARPQDVESILRALGNH